MHKVQYIGHIELIPASEQGKSDTCASRLIPCFARAEHIDGWFDFDTCKAIADN